MARNKNSCNWIKAKEKKEIKIIRLKYKASRNGKIKIEFNFFKILRVLLSSLKVTVYLKGSIY